MQAIRAVLDKTITVICVALFMFMTVIGTYQIVTRYFFNSPSTISEELVTYSFTWLSILSAALVFGSRGHLCMTFFYGKFTGRKRVVLDMISELLVLATAITLLIYGGYIMAAENMNQVTASLGVNMGIMYAVLPVSGVLITIYCFLNFADMIKLFNSSDVANYGTQTED